MTEERVREIIREEMVGQRQLDKVLVKLPDNDDWSPEPPRNTWAVVRLNSTGEWYIRWFDEHSHAWSSPKKKTRHHMAYLRDLDHVYSTIIPLPGDGWVAHNGGECQIPDAKAGEWGYAWADGYVCECAEGKADGHFYGWGRGIPTETNRIVAYHLLKRTWTGRDPEAPLFPVGLPVEMRNDDWDAWTAGWMANGGEVSEYSNLSPSEPYDQIRPRGFDPAVAPEDVSMSEKGGMAYAADHECVWRQFAENYSNDPDVLHVELLRWWR